MVVSKFVVLVLIFSFLFLPCACIKNKQSSDSYVVARELMVSQQIESRGVSDKLVLKAMRKVPRHEFIPDELLFNVEVEAQSDLNNGAISEGLWQDFKDNKISLSDNAAVSVEETDARWLITDEGKKYSVRKQENKLNIYEGMKPYAYDDNPQLIGEDQTISQPYIVALMTELLELKGGEKVLEIGTGSGYQAAILAEIAAEVYTIEIIESLSKNAEATLKRMGYQNITVKWGDGYKGWEEHAPFDHVIVTAAPDHVPQPLVDQLKIGGRMVIPVGDYYQELKLLTKTADGVEEKSIIPVRFVPMTGEAQRKGERKK